MKKIIFAIAAASILSACSDEDGARKQLEQMGYTNVVTTGYDFFGCGEGDTFATGFRATSPTGQQVTGVYCSGLLKGGTVRFY